MGTPGMEWDMGCDETEYSIQSDLLGIGESYRELSFLQRSTILAELSS